ncbi:glycosyltransferase family 2 protein [Pinibacter soli]|uniref:Glycosyltransferase family 2 protein n=1 Tax=Pinibacter soli TaxID=3044211 RepID=A0ABT6RCM7_9BACT|nr:glycosyltransferase family 2 protein [Pinibacter soli]MDI3320263.1 glycosyltransferase family 2 protein [Pinibacter soli]
MQNPLVTIITVVYNGEDYIEQAITSVLQQSYPNIEYIVVDGLSADNTMPIVNRYKDRIQKIISEKDQGISDAFNKGIRHATGEIIGILNADDWYEKDTVEKVVNEIGKADIAYGDLRLWKNNAFDSIFCGNHNLLKREMSVNHPTVFIRKHCYEKFGVFNLSYKYAMDYELLLRFMLKGCTYKYIPSVLANMRWAGASDKYWYDAVKELRKIKDIYLSDEKLRHQLFFVKQTIAIAAAKLFQKLGLNSVVKFYRSRFSPIRKKYSD